MTPAKAMRDDVATRHVWRAGTCAACGMLREALGRGAMRYTRPDGSTVTVQPRGNVSMPMCVAKPKAHAPCARADRHRRAVEVTLDPEEIAWLDERAATLGATRSRVISGLIIMAQEAEDPA